MAIQGRLRELGFRHQNLEREIHIEVCRPVADAIRLRDLKRQKLRLKDEIEYLKAHGT
ncbi:MAG: DUF465 domain-containing protein [Alphaproteobacteria bacterium]|jgi:hypothetical protein|nr:DUF465 domain-containing protein [Alphaproteobacteria bacterium]